MTAPALITAFTAMFVIDPPGLAPLFIAMTQACRRPAAQDRPARLRRRGGADGAPPSVGEALLGFIGISMPAFRIAGGVLLFLTALDMLFERRASAARGQRRGGSDPTTTRRSFRSRCR